MQDLTLKSLTLTILKWINKHELKSRRVLHFNYLTYHWNYKPNSSTKYCTDILKNCLQYIMWWHSGVIHLYLTEWKNVYRFVNNSNLITCTWNKIWDFNLHTIKTKKKCDDIWNGIKIHVLNICYKINHFRYAQYIIFICCIFFVLYSLFKQVQFAKF